MRALLISLLVLGFALPVLAREWHAREGSFSVKAELLDLRDGSVILKREDNGLEIAVPLDKLSLDDVRFVHAELARLTDAINGGAPTKMAPASASSPAPAASFAPPRAPTASEPPASPPTTTMSPEVPAASTTLATDLTPANQDDYPSMPARAVQAPPLANSSRLDWQAAPDPSPFDYTLPDTVKVNASAPKDAYSLHPVFSEHPSHFMFFEESSKTFYAFHLPTQKLVGGLKFESYGLQHVAFSTDGRYLTVTAPNATTHVQEVQVWSFVTRKLVRTFTPGKSSTHISSVGFAGSDRIVIARSSDNVVACFDIATGRKISEAPLPLFSNDDSIAISPGGAYAALYAPLEKNAHVIDLRTGVEAGIIGGKTQIPSSATLKEISFSPDGEELLLYSTSGSGRHLASWDMRTGERLVDLNFTDDPAKMLPHSFSYRGRPLEWRPDRSGWLISGGVLVEHGSTDVVWIDQRRDDSSDLHESRRFVDNNRLLVFTRAEDRRMLMSLKTISEEEIAANKVLVASGATAADQGLPPLTPIVTADVKEIATNIQWTYQPDAAPEVPAGTLKDGARIPANQLQLGHLYQCRPSNRAVLGLREPDEKRRVNGLTHIEDQYFDLLDLATGKPLQRTSLTFAALLMATAPTGDWAAFTTKEGKDRVDLFDLTTGKPLLAFRPMESGSDKIEAMAFGSDRTLLWVLTDAGELTQWKLPECRAVARRTYGRTTRLQSSPSGRTLCVMSPRQLELLDADSGEMLGTLASPTDEQISGFGQVAFSEDGRQLASARYSVNGPQHVIVWDLAQNSVEKTFEIPHKPFDVAWGSKDVLLIRVMLNNGKLILATHLVGVHLPSERIVWNYLLPHGVFGYRGSDGRQWYVAGTLTRSDSTLLAAELPQPDEQASFRDLKPLTPVLTRGDEIAILVNAEVPSLDLQRKNLSKELQDAFVAKALLSGYQPDPEAEYILSVEVHEKLTPDTLRLRVLGQLYVESIQVTEVTGELRLADRNGKVVWTEAISQKTNANLVQRGIPRGMKVADFLRLQQWRGVLEWLFKTPIPATIYASSGADGAGISILTPEGVDVRKTMVPPQDEPMDKAI